MMLGQLHVGIIRLQLLDFSVNFLFLSNLQIVWEIDQTIYATKRCAKHLGSCSEWCYHENAFLQIVQLNHSLTFSSILPTFVNPNYSLFYYFLCLNYWFFHSFIPVTDLLILCIYWMKYLAHSSISYLSLWISDFWWTLFWAAHPSLSSKWTGMFLKMTNTQNICEEV